MEWEQYPLEEYPLARPMFDSVGTFSYTTRMEFVPNMAIEDHWLNCQDDYEARIKDYFQMDLKLTKEFLQFPLSLKVIDKDSPNILDPVYNRDRIFDKVIMNVKVATEEHDDIMDRARHVIEITKE